jgi:hypothetical protein
LGLPLQSQLYSLVCSLVIILLCFFNQGNAIQICTNLMIYSRILHSNHSSFSLSTGGGPPTIIRYIYIGSFGIVGPESATYAWAQNVTRFVVCLLLCP